MFKEDAAKRPSSKTQSSFLKELCVLKNLNFEKVQQISSRRFIEAIRIFGSSYNANNYFNSYSTQPSKLKKKT